MPSLDTRKEGSSSGRHQGGSIDGCGGCLETNLIPIVCTGETQDERESGQAKEIILGDLASCLDGLTASELSRMIIAYEPIWAIGTGLTATPEIAQEVHQWIRSWTAREYSPQLSSSVRILYGGSVKPDNASDLMRQEDIDGVLVWRGQPRCEELPGNRPIRIRVVPFTFRPGKKK